MAQASDQATVATSPTDSSIPSSVLRSRWLLVVAVAALVAFGTPLAPSPAQYALVVAMMVSNLVLAMLRNQGLQLEQTLEVVTVADVLVVTVIVGWVDPHPPTYLAVFAALILASALGRVGVSMLLMLLVCGLYAGYLYTEIGADFWRQVSLIVRVPFLFAVGLHIASIAAHLKTGKDQREGLVARVKQHAERADQLSREQDRLQALSQIGRLALTAAEAHPVRVLLEMAQRAQRALGATRCALVIFPGGAQEHGWNGHTKDHNTEVRALVIEPGALAAILTDGKLSELHPGEDKDLLERVKVFFPDSNPFGSLLVAPIETDGALRGALFLVDTNHTRKYSEGERDFFWTVALMTGAFIRARNKLENEVQLRSLITAAPVILFAVSPEATVTLFEGRGTAVLGDQARGLVGKSLLSLVGNPEETREAFEQALGGHIATGSMLLRGMLFETQYSPLRGVDGKISGVMGVTTAILDAPAAADTSQATATAPPQPGPTAPAPRRPAGGTGAPVAATTDPPAPGGALDDGQPRRPASPGARPDLKPLIPLRDEE